MPITNVTDFFVYLDMLGIADSLLPFLLIFTIIFAVLEKVNIFSPGAGVKSTKFNFVIALAIALLVVIPHIMGRYPEGKDAVVIINNALPNVAVLAIALVLFLLLLGIFGGKAGGLTGVAGIIAIAAIIWIFGSSAGWFAELPAWLSDPAVQVLIVIILAFGFIVWFIVGGSGGAQGSGLQNAFNWINDIFKRP